VEQWKGYAMTRRKPASLAAAERRVVRAAMRFRRFVRSKYDSVGWALNDFKGRTLMDRLNNSCAALERQRAAGRKG